jgi:hypothetical protein
MNSEKFSICLDQRMKNIILEERSAECGRDQQVTKIANMTDELRKILYLLGPAYEKYYS